MADPALSLDRARQTWHQHGFSDKWIQQCMTGQETRNKLRKRAESHAASMQILLCSTVVNPARNRRNLSQEMLT